MDGKNDLIRRQDAIRFFEESETIDIVWSDAVDFLNSLPAAPAPITCEQCEHWKEHYFCKVVFHPTQSTDTCATVLGAKRKGER